MHIDYQALIQESEAELHALEKKHRHTQLGQRLQLLRLLKRGECSSMKEAANLLGYSERQCLRWLKQYREQGIAAVLVNRISMRGNHQERITGEAWLALNQAMTQGDIGSYEQARVFLAKQGVVYKDPSSIYRLFKRHGIKAKAGRYRHEKADAEQQEAFKKSSLTS